MKYVFRDFGGSLSSEVNVRQLIMMMMMAKYVALVLKNSVYL